MANHKGSMDVRAVLDKLIDENIYHLSSGIEVLSLITDDHYRYSEDSSSPWMSGIGKHFRHLIDFYDCFFDQFPDVNYDLRKRNVDIESDKNVTVARLEYFKKILLTYKMKDIYAVIDLYQGDIPNNNNINTVKSTLGRELRFLTEHTVHHFAIIAMFLKQYGYAVPLGFGVAQSTLDYEAGL